MKIYDCTTYCGEDLLLDLRLNVLDKDVDFFIICELSKFHSGKPKEKKFSIKNFENFKHKIRYFYIDQIPVHDGDNWKYENFQRNETKRGLYDAENEDIIIVSDVDEIPNLKNKNFLKYDSCVFLQNFYYYKLNILCYDGLKWEKKWPGSKCIKFKYFENSQKVRELRVRKIPKWRIDKKINRKIIKNGGWHFSYLMTPEKIQEKIENFAHSEFKNYSKIEHIRKMIESKQDIFSRNDLKFKTVSIDKTYPDYICNNLEIYKKWIDQK